MATIQITARRAVVALGVAIAALGTPAALAGSTDVPRAVADPGSCVTSSEPGDVSLDCTPAVVPEVGAPSEMDLTDSNQGINSPEHRR
jgi:hypothetical protein